MKIGVGVTTTSNRKQHYQEWLRSFHDHTPDSNDPTKYVLFTAHDQPTIAQAKNMCLIALEDCDYIFLFDDDCFITREGWENYFIDAHRVTGEHHFLYLNKRTHNFYKYENGLSFFHDCGGCFMFLTKDVVKHVGGMNKKYKRYGYEHAGYSQRIFRSGFNSAPYIMPQLASGYLFSMDYDGAWDGLIHYPSCMDDMSNMGEYLKYNFEIYKEDIKQIEQPL